MAIVVGKYCERKCVIGEVEAETFVYFWVGSEEKDHKESIERSFDDIPKAVDSNESAISFLLQSVVQRDERESACTMIV